MMIAVEGPDGAGKSTLVYELALKLRRSTYHPGGPATSEDNFRTRVTAQELVGNVVHDRLMVVSEPIYAGALARPIFHIVDRQAEYYLRNLSFPLYLVYCRLPDANDMFDNIDRSTKPHKSPEHIESMRGNYIHIVNMYDSRMAQLAGPDYPMVVVLPFNWQLHTVDDLVDKIKGHAP